MNPHKDITLSAVIGHKDCFEKTLKAIIYSSKQFHFENIQVLSCIPFDIKNIKCINISSMSYGEYNDFIIKSYSQYIDNHYVLHVQNDGFILNGNAWSDEFLDYDYIGAPWTIVSPNSPYGVNESNRVGNGGFTLRSKKFLNISSEFCPTHNGMNEDVVVCRIHRDMFISHGIKYATDQVAAKFSIEDDQATEYVGQSHKDYKTIKSFGFHNRDSSALKLLDEIILSDYY
jgi:hypothetical protein